MSATLLNHQDALSRMNSQASRGEDVRLELRALKQQLDALPRAPEPEQATVAKWEHVVEELKVPVGAFGETCSAERRTELIALEGTIIGAALDERLQSIASEWTATLRSAEASEQFAAADAARLELLAEVLQRYAALLAGIAALGHHASSEKP